MVFKPVTIDLPLPLLGNQIEFPCSMTPFSAPDDQFQQQLARHGGPSDTQDVKATRSLLHQVRSSAKGGSGTECP